MVNPGVRHTEVRRIKGGRMLTTNVTNLLGGQRNVYALHEPNASTAALAGASSELIWSFNSTSPYVTTALSPHLALQPLIIHNENPIYTRTVDLKRYELTDHLGNVRAVVSDKLLTDYDATTNANPTNLRAQVLSRSDYYPFGSLLPGRNYSSSNYRFGFNGKENDNEVHGATGTYQDYGMRAYDTRVGRFFSVDPLSSHYPWYTPYQFAGNKPIWAIDRDGLEELVMQEITFRNSRGESFVHKVNWRFVRPGNRAVDEHGAFMFATDVASRDATINEQYARPAFYQAAKAAGRITVDPSNSSYRAVTKYRSQNNYRDRGDTYINLVSRLGMGDDMGETPDEVAAAVASESDGFQQVIDNMVGILVNVPGSTLTVTGYASPKATNRKGTQESTTRGNNVGLAAARTAAGVAYILQYAHDKYGVDIDPSRVIGVEGGIRAKQGESENSVENRSMTFETKSPNQ